MAPPLEQTATSDQAAGVNEGDREDPRSKGGLKEWWISSGLAALELENTGSVGEFNSL